MLASCGDDNMINIWNFETFELQYQIASFKYEELESEDSYQRMIRADFLPFIENSIICLDHNFVIKIWDYKNNELLK